MEVHPDPAKGGSPAVDQEYQETPMLIRADSPKLDNPMRPHGSMAEPPIRSLIRPAIPLARTTLPQRFRPRETIHRKREISLRRRRMARTRLYDAVRRESGEAVLVWAEVL